MTSDNIVIRVRNPGKKYTIGGPQEKYLTFRDAKSQFGEGTIQTISSCSTGRRVPERSKDVISEVGRRVLSVSHNMGCNTIEPISYLL